MYPSFYGMTSQVYKKGQASPSMFEKIYNWTIKSASNYNLNAEDSGNLYIEIASTRGGIFACELENSKILGVWPTYNKKYTFYVNGTKSYLTVPADFNFEEVMLKAYPFGTDGKSLDKYVDALRNSGKIVQNNGTLWLDLGKINKGESILNFDILGGDMLFVDKFTYNFKKPQIGEPIVFLTRYCEGLTERNGGVPDDKYYIKRLVGKGGDSLKVEGSILMRNKEPIKGSPAFKKNFEKEGNYCGYIADGALANNAIVKVPERFYYAMGDNSANSLDSRYWGFVPEKAIVGKSLLIFYPFTERWGHTK